MSAPTFAGSPVRHSTLVSYALPASPADIASQRDDNPYTVPAIRDEAGTDEATATPQTLTDTETTLAALVDAREFSETRDAEHECLAISVYFESKGEPLSGQLAVAQTLINRAASGRFPTSVCGVMRQRGQFSFVRDGSLPVVPRASTAWREAVAIASVALGDLWRETAPGALFFHASHVAPNWKLTRIAKLGNHIFYR